MTTSEASVIEEAAADRARPPDVATAFESWVRPHWPAMARLARRMSRRGEWEDVLQEALASAWRKRAQYDPARGTAATWLLAITVDRSRKSHRRILPFPASDRIHDGDLPVDVPSTETLPSDLDLDRAVHRLAHRQRLAVTLHYFVGLSVTDTAAVMACAEGTVKSTLSDARARLRDDLGKDYR